MINMIKVVINGWLCKTCKRLSKRNHCTRCRAELQLPQVHDIPGYAQISIDSTTNISCTSVHGISDAHGISVEYIALAKCSKGMHSDACLERPLP